MIEVRALTQHAEFADAVELQQTIWGFEDTCARSKRVASGRCSTIRSVSVTWIFISGRLTGSKSRVLVSSSYLPGGSSKNPNLPFSSEVADFFSPPPSLAR
jgi:hypothetical protein